MLLYLYSCFAYGSYCIRHYIVSTISNQTISGFMFFFIRVKKKRYSGKKKRMEFILLYIFHLWLKKQWTREIVQWARAYGGGHGPDLISCTHKVPLEHRSWVWEREMRRREKYLQNFREGLLAVKHQFLKNKFSVSLPFKDLKQNYLFQYLSINLKREDKQLKKRCKQIMEQNKNKSRLKSTLLIYKNMCMI